MRSTSQQCLWHPHVEITRGRTFAGRDPGPASCASLSVPKPHKSSNNSHIYDFPHAQTGNLQGTLEARACQHRFKPQVAHLVVPSRSIEPDLPPIMPQNDMHMSNDSTTSESESSMTPQMQVLA